MLLPESRLGFHKLANGRRVFAPSLWHHRLSPCCLPQNYSFSFFLACAGTPATSESGGTSLVITDPAPETEPCPTRTGATSIVSDPIFTSSSMNVGFLFLP